MMCSAFGVAIMLASINATIADAQSPIDVQRAAAQGEYLRAMVRFDTLPKRKITTDATIAVARSAWALSLPERAAQELDTVLRGTDLTPVERTRALLSRGIIELQENRQQLATMFAEQAVATAGNNGALRARAYLLWGQALSETKALGAAEEKLKLAVVGADSEDSISAHFMLAECQLLLGKPTDARQNYQAVPINHEHAPGAIRGLAEVALQLGESNTVEFWLNKGREVYPDRFLDSWVDFALLEAAVKQNDPVKAIAVQVSANNKYPPSDQWLTLLNATAEGFAWNNATFTSTHIAKR